MSELVFSVEPAREADQPAIERLHARAFGPGRFARTAFRVREQAGQNSGTGFVARVGTLMVGSVLITPVLVGATRGYMLGPLTVEPAFEGRGIGARLMAEAARAARDNGATLILLVGDESYYSRFGYKRVPIGQIALPGPVDPARLLALELDAGVLGAARGAVRAG